MKKIDEATKNVIVGVFQSIIGLKRLFVELKLISKFQKTGVNFETPDG